MTFRSAIDEVRITADLIAINSENPPGDERGVSDYLSDLLSRIGCAIEIVEVRSNRPNLLATATGSRPGPRIILNGHMDTKPALHAQSGQTGWTYGPHSPTLRDSRLYGLGACDTKGGIAAQITALVRFLNTRREFSGTVCFQGVADEENGSNFGTRALADKARLLADFAIVAEPTQGLVSRAQMGNMWAEVIITGESGHAGTPWKAKDGVRAMLSFISEVDRRLATVPTDLRFKAHPFLNVGRIEGGDHPGTIPGQCSMRCAIRPLPGQTKSQYLSMLFEIGQGIAKATGTEVIVSPYAGGGLEPNEVSSADSMLRILEAGAEERTEECFYGASDAQFFGAVGTPAVVLGPGSLEQAHAPDEYVDVAQISHVSHRIETFLSTALSSSPRATEG